MKLKILIATACVAMACSLAVSAETTVKSDDGAGEVTTSVAEQNTMLAVNVGDTISISVTTDPESDITLLSYRYGEEADSNNIQYVDQYVADASGICDITYKIRELADKDGVYCLKINDGSTSGVATVYYKVGAPELVDEADNVISTYYVQYNFTHNSAAEGAKSEFAGTSSVVYRASLKGNGGNISGYGFNVGIDTIKSYSGDMPENAAITVDNNGSFTFDMTIYKIDDFDKLAKVQVVPYVNYATDTASDAAGE